ncbi:exodeoxyribonuclease VII large subunit [candidate division FCPU426 bacterium]|nr:exodeoxyribonuclease VII large subunit [candidate division FCPU426 bacterium]
MKTPAVERKVFSVSEIVDQARGLLEKSFARVWVEGEISNFKVHTSGHCYFTLKDGRSQLRAAMFKGASRLVRFQVEDGLQIVAGGRLSIYTARGDFQLVVESLEPAGLGALQLAFEQLKRKLAKEGLFAAARKKPLPVFPRKIAVVTSPTGAAIRDILNVTARRSPWADIAIYPVRVQGEGAAREIARALARLNEAGGWDVIICGRGGGSLEDLWAFNEEIVARAIAASAIPVISAVGHEVDYTIADFVADARAETPTAAAEMVMRDRREILEQLRTLRRMLGMRLTARLREWRHRLEQVVSSRLMQKPLAVFEPLAQRLDDLKVTMQEKVKNRVQWLKEHLRGLAAEMEALSPLRVMGRGYSLVYKLPQGALVRDAGRLAGGDRIKIRFYHGETLCRVESSKKKS